MSKGRLSLLERLVTLTTAVSVSTESYASVLAKSAPRFRGGAFSENTESSRSKTEAASHTTKRSDVRSTTP